MKRLQLTTILFFIPLLLIGCSNAPNKYTYAKQILPNEKNDPVTKSRLKTQHQEWKGTPYRYGGLSKHGVDCSGFVYITYRSKFGIGLPRSTEEQSKTGTQVSQSKLTAGDLVFFKTGLFKKHVGIYMGNRQFLHASTSKGVTISNMDNVYWRDKYWKARRI